MAETRDPAHLRALVSLISQSVEAVLDQENASSSQTTRAGSDPSPLQDVLVVLESACAELCASVAPPERTMASHAFAMIMPACLRVALEARVAEHLQNGPKSAAELAALTGVDGGKLVRVLRYLTLRHCFIEVGKDVFANNRLSACLLPEDTTSALISIFVDEFYNGFGRLADVLRDPEWTSSADKAKSAFARAYGAHFFEMTEASPLLGSRFARAIQGHAKLTGGHRTLVESYPWDALPADSTFCDLGGSIGDAAHALLAAQSHLRAVVQDLPETLGRAHAFWHNNPAAEAALARGRVQFVAIDFFTSAPVPGCAVYYLKHVLHDWPDADCVAILRNVRAAMTAPRARVLIHEIVLDHHPSEAPFPLLPTYGAGAQLTYGMDLHMMASLNSRERTLDEFIALCARADLKYLKTWDGGELKMVEFEAS